MNNNNWLSKKRKVQFQPRSLFAISSAVYADTKNNNNEFAWQLIKNHSEKYDIVYTTCYVCDHFDNYLCIHKGSQAVNTVSGKYLKLTHRDATFAFPSHE